MDLGTHDVSRIVSLGLVALLVGVAGYTAIGPGLAESEPQPADKVAVAGSTVEIMESTTANGSFSEVHEIFSLEMRTSSTSDLIFQLTAECALWTDVTTVGNDESEAIATVKAWVEVDGEPVSVAGDDDGEIVLCNREYRVETMQFENENATIERYLRSRQANAFNWIHIDAGSGVHNITVKAQLEGQATSVSEANAQAKAAIGKRTLVIEPVQLPPGSSL